MTGRAEHAGDAAARQDDGVPAGLELEQDMPFQRRTWAVQRVAWALMACLVGAACLGAFGGGGPLAQARAGGEAEGLAVAYERFMRHDAPARIVVELLPGAGPRVELALRGAFRADLQVERVTPQPIATRAGADGPVLAFLREDLTSGVVLDVRPLATGPLTATLALAGRPPVAATLFAWP